jgi:hypothetical protein
MKKLLKIGETILERPSFDWLAAAILTLIAWRLHLDHLLALVPAENQRSAYSAAAGVLGVIAGFVVASAYFFAGLDNPTANRLRRNRGPLLNRSLVGAFLTLSFSSVACVCAVVATPTFPPVVSTLTLSGLASGGILSASKVAADIFIPATCVAILKLARIGALSWAMLATQYEHSRNSPTPV